jgi:hypothetical protein
LTEFAGKSVQTPPVLSVAEAYRLVVSNKAFQYGAAGTQQDEWYEEEDAVHVFTV